MLNLATKIQTKSQSILLPQKAAVNLKAAGPEPIELKISHKDGTFHYGTATSFNLREIMQNCTSIELTSKKEFNLQYTVQERQTAEPLDDRPVPEPEDTTSPIMQMQRRIRQELGIIREEFVNDTDLPGYELDEDDEALFEEEKIALQKMQEAASAAKKEITHDTETTVEDPPSTQPTRENVTDPQPKSTA